MYIQVTPSWKYHHVGVAIKGLLVARLTCGCGMKGRGGICVMESIGMRRQACVAVEFKGPPMAKMWGERERKVCIFGSL